MSASSNNNNPSAPNATIDSSAAGSSVPFGEEFSPRILSISLNATSTAFAVGLENGYRVYSVDSLRELHRQGNWHICYYNITIEYDEGGIGLIELLDRSNIIALVGGGQKPRFAPNKVMLWDNKASKYVAELEFRSPVLGLRMSTER